MNREQRYLVVKLADMKNWLTPAEQKIVKILAAKVDMAREGMGRAPLQTVVVEADWPEYEPTWAAIAARVDAMPQPDPAAPAQRMNPIYRDAYIRCASMYDDAIDRIGISIDTGGDVLRLALPKKGAVFLVNAIQFCLTNVHSESASEMPNVDESMPSGSDSVYPPAMSPIASSGEP
jgi:hypothetical protein